MVFAALPLQAQTLLVVGDSLSAGYGLRQHEAWPVLLGQKLAQAGYAHSVVNAKGRAHGMANLFVADASFFPTSMGVNPSLTIAANALRVAREMSHSP